jgi:integrase
VVRFALDTKVTTPGEVVPSDLVAWLASKTLAAETAYAYRAGLCAFFSFCASHGLVAANPAQDLPPIRRPATIPRPCPDDAVVQGLANANDQVRVMIRLAAEHGYRTAEIARCHGPDLVTSSFGLVLVIYGKGGKQRLAFVDPDETELINAFRVAAAGPVFPGRIEGCLSARYVGKLISKALPGEWTAHKLRTRFASTSYNAHPDLLALMDLLGHSSPSTTLRYTRSTNAAGRALTRAARIQSR